MDLTQYNNSLAKLQEFLKSDSQDIQLSQEELEKILKSEGSEAEKSKTILDMIKAKKKKDEEKEPEEKPGDEPDDDEPEDEPEEGTKKSYSDVVDGIPILKSIFNALTILEKKLEKSEKKNAELVKALAEVQIQSGEVLKSISKDIDILGKYPLLLKGQLTPKDAQDFQKAIIERYPTTQQNTEIPKELEFLRNPAEVEKRLEKACFIDKKLPQYLFTQEETAKFNGQYITKSREAVNILQSYNN